MVVKGEWIVVVEIRVPVVRIEENISTEEFIFNELALVVDSIKIGTDKVDSIVAEDEVVDKAGNIDVNNEPDIVVRAVNVVEAVTVVEALTFHSLETKLLGSFCS